MNETQLRLSRQLVSEMNRLGMSRPDTPSTRTSCPECHTVQGVPNLLDPRSVGDLENLLTSRVETLDVNYQRGVWSVTATWDGDRMVSRGGEAKGEAIALVLIGVLQYQA